MNDLKAKFNVTKTAMALGSPFPLSLPFLLAKQNNGDPSKSHGSYGTIMKR